MANTYKALQTITVGAGGASSMDFTNIPQTYTDLIIKVSSRADFTGIRVRFNNDSLTSYSWRSLRGTGSVVDSENNTAYGSPYNTFVYFRTATSTSDTSNTFGNGEIYIPNYISSNAKSTSSDGVNENNATQAFMSLTSGLWTNTDPINRVTLIADSGTFVQHTTATLYGVFNADVSSAPATPTIGTATATGTTTATVSFTGVSNAASYTATSTPGSITATGTTSPLSVTGLTTGTAYTFKVKSNNPFGSSAESAASNSITPTYVPSFESISTTTLTSAASSVSITGIPSTYAHLQMRVFMISDLGGRTPRMNINSWSSANGYSSQQISGDGSSFTGANNTSNGELYPLYGGQQTYPVLYIIDFYDYTNTSKNKNWRALVGGDNNGAGVIAMSNGVFQTTNAISSIQFSTQGGSNYTAGTVFALYGIKG